MAADGEHGPAHRQRPADPDHRRRRWPPAGRGRPAQPRPGERALFGRLLGRRTERGAESRAGGSCCSAATPSRARGATGRALDRAREPVRPSRRRGGRVRSRGACCGPSCTSGGRRRDMLMYSLLPATSAEPPSAPTGATLITASQHGSARSSKPRRIRPNERRAQRRPDGLAALLPLLVDPARGPGSLRRDHP